MPIPLGILAAAGRSQAPAGAFVLLESTVLTGSQASVEFTNLTTKYAATYQHLQIRSAVRSARSGNLGSALSLRLNGDLGSNYAWHSLYGDGANAVSIANPNSNNAQVGISIPAANATANAFAGLVIDILDPFETTKNTTVRTLGGVTPNNFVYLSSLLWNNQNSVTTLRMYDTTGADLAQFSRFSLYGIKATA